MLFRVPGLVKSFLTRSRSENGEPPRQRKPLPPSSPPAWGGVAAGRGGGSVRRGAFLPRLKDKKAADSCRPQVFSTIWRRVCSWWEPV